MATETQYVFFLGNHSALCASEVFHSLRALGVNPKVVGCTYRYLIVTCDSPILESFYDRLGGVDRVGVVLSKQESTPVLEDIFTALSPLPRKFRLGVSGVGWDIPSLKELISAKKLKRSEGVSLKFMTPRKGNRLNTAQVLYNGLLRAPNAEMTVLVHKEHYLIVKTVWAQDIASYEKRDTDRPSRNARSGMLPPKLAQLMLGLGASFAPEHQGKLSVYDPFCGSGTVLQEGWLDGFEMTGSDEQPASTRSSQKNLEWVAQQFSLDPETTPKVFVHDVRTPFPEHLNNAIDVIVCEPFLGKPLSAPLAENLMTERLEELGDLYLSFFRNAKSVLRPGGVIVFALPAFVSRLGTPSQGSSRKVASNFLLFPQGFIDVIGQIGYSEIHLLPEELVPYFPDSGRTHTVYARPDAFVGREITIWRKA